MFYGVLRRSTIVQSLSQVATDVETSVHADSSRAVSESPYVPGGKKPGAGDACHQGLQVPIVSSSVKGSQDDGSVAVAERAKDEPASMGEVSTSVKGVLDAGGDFYWSILECVGRAKSRPK